MERSLDLEITRRCNLRCDHCFVGWSRDWTHDLPRETAEEILREGAGRFDLLHVTGGEPFARRDVWELLELGLALGYPRALVNTNGTMLGEEDVARLAGYGGRVALSISFDGPRALHDAVRGEGRFAQADAALAALLARGVPVTLMTVVTSAVLADLPAFLRERMAAHPGLAGITLFPVGVGPEGSQKPGAALAALRPAELGQLAAITALAWRAGVNVTVGAYPMINPLLRALGVPEARLYQCTAGRGRVCVHANGDVSSCHPVKEPLYGRWSSGLFDRLGHTPLHAALATRDFEGCRSCEHREGCGHCRAFVTSSGHELLGNDGVCLEAVPGRREAMRAAPPQPAGLLPPGALLKRRDEAEHRVAQVQRLSGLLAGEGLDRIGEIFTADCRDGNPMPLQPQGCDGIRFKLAFWHAARPLARSIFREVRATAEGAEARWDTESAPGEPETRWHARFRFAGGRISAFQVQPYVG